jgi:hypothetical protein
MGKARTVMVQHMVDSPYVVLERNGCTQHQGLV